MELNELYGKIIRLKTKKEIVTTYGCEGNIDDPDGDVLTDLLEYIYNNYPKERPDWMEALYQILCWQFQSFHEGVLVYYENFYGESDYSTIVRTAEFLRKGGYIEIAKQYQRGIVACERHDYPDNLKADAKEIDAWINSHTATVWDFCLDILEKNQSEWLENRGYDKVYVE